MQCDHVVGVMESAKLDSYQHPHQLLENGMEESLDQAAEDG
ncbi:Uncharacterized protein AC497_0665 [Pseudomonas savastanoi pv. glycinea]|nr:Uncharacterized protein AC497_0665 [Pseudomonas savastanoi pv. glycinea]